MWLPSMKKKLQLWAGEWTGRNGRNYKRKKSSEETRRGRRVRRKKRRKGGEPALLSAVGELLDLLRAESGAEVHAAIDLGLANGRDEGEENTRIEGQLGLDCVDQKTCWSQGWEKRLRREKETNQREQGERWTSQRGRQSRGRAGRRREEQR